MKTNIEKPTTVYRTPILFLGEEYEDSLSLLEALLDHWDLGIAALKSGYFLEFDAKYAGGKEPITDACIERLYEMLWNVDRNVNPDVIFVSFLLQIEPAFSQLPYPDPDTRKVSFLSDNDCKKILEEGVYQVNYEAIVDRQFDPQMENSYDRGYVKSAYIIELLVKDLLKHFGFPNVWRAYSAYQRAHRAESRSRGREVLNEALKSAAETIYDSNVFTCNDLQFETYEEFARYFVTELRMDYNVTWERFIAQIFAENDKHQSITVWLKKIGQMEYAEKFRDWQEKYSKVKIPEKLKRYEIVISLEEYWKWGNKSEHDKIIDKLEKQEQDAFVPYEKEYKVTAIKEIEELYQMLYALLQEGAADIQRPWSKLKIASEFETRDSNWRANYTKHEKYKKLFQAMRNHNVSALFDEWNYKGIVLSGGTYSAHRVLFLLACAPIEETYQADIENLIETLKTKKDTISSDTWIKFIQDVYQYILEKLYDAKVSSDVTEAYLRLLDALAKMHPSGLQLKDYVRIDRIVSGIKTQIGYTEEYLKKKPISTDDIKLRHRNDSHMPYRRGTVSYMEFEKSDISKKWRKQLGTLTDIEEKLNQYEKDAKDISSEIADYFVTHCFSTPTAEIKAWVTNKSEEYKKAVEASRGLEDEWRQTCVDTEWVRKQYIKERHAYEEKYREEERLREEAEKQAKLRKEKRIRLMKTTAIIVGILVILFIAVTAGSHMYNNNLSWNVENGMQSMKYDSSSTKNLELLEKRISNNLEADGTWVIPAKAEVLGDLGITRLQNEGETFVPAVEKLVLSEGITETSASFDISGCGQIKAIEFPTSMRNSILKLF